MSDKLPDNAPRCSVCKINYATRSRIDDAGAKLCCDNWTCTGRDVRRQYADLPHAYAARQVTPGSALTIVFETGVNRQYSEHKSPAWLPWHELLNAACTIQWLADVSGSYTAPSLPSSLSDADAATECARLLESVRVDGKRGEIVTRILELTDAAVRALGGELAVKVK